MTETRIIDAAALQDIPAWEQANRAKLLQAEFLGDGTARAEVLPVADLGWLVSVWNCAAELVIVTEQGEQDAGDLFELDPETLQALIDQVVYTDHDGAINMSGRYYPLSEESQQLYNQLMATAKDRESAA